MLDMVDAQSTFGISSNEESHSVQDEEEDAGDVEEEINEPTSDTEEDHFHQSEAEPMLNAEEEQQPNDGDFIIRDVNVPVNMFNRKQRYSIRFLELCEQCGISSNAHKDLVNFINEMLSDPSYLRSPTKMLHRPAIDRILAEKVPLKLFNEHSTCPKGCYVYSKDDNLLTSCPYCESPRSENRMWPVLNLGSKFAELIASEKTREKLLYRHENYPKEEVLANDLKGDKVYNDIFDSAGYANLLRKKEVDNPLDIYFNLNIDGFTSKVSSTKLTIIHCVVLNYSPTERFNNEHTFQVGVIHSVKKPNLYSYLRPIIDELLSLQKKPLKVFLNGEFLAISSITCFRVLGDGVEVNELMSFAGHMSTYGCRFCLVKGERRKDTVDTTNRGGLYFVQRNQPMRTFKSLIHTETNPDYIRNSFYGIKEPSIFKGLHFFTGVEAHGLDELHWVCNLSKTIIDMISPRYNKMYKYVGNEDAYPFFLSNQSIEKMRDAIDRSRNFIPATAFKGSFYGYDPNRSKSIYRSSDYIDFLQYNLILYVPLFEDSNVGDAIACLIRGVCLALQFSISTEDLNEIKSNFKVWFNILDKLVEQKKISIAVFKANVHHLDHAIFVIKQNSTLRGTSVRVMERNIGEIKKTLKARVNVGENVNNIIRRKGLLTFIKNTGMMSFQSLKEQEEERCSHKASTFMYHSSMKEG
ncbi:unnamed protein product [Mucor hiemalis]